MTSHDEYPADADMRAAESRLQQHFDLSGTEHLITAPVGIGDGLVTVHVQDFGPADAGPPVLFLHGIASASAAAYPLMQALAGRRVLALDWSGHGLSGRCVLPVRADIRAYVLSVLRGVLDAIEVPVVDLVGHSLGGQFSLFLATGAPERVRRVVLLGAPGGAFAQMRPIPAMRLIAVPGVGGLLLRLPASRGQYRRTTEISLGKGVLDRWPDDLSEVGYLAARRPGFAPSVTSLFRCLATPAGVRPRVTVPDSELAAIAAPVLLIWGDRDVFLTPARARGQIDALPSATLVATSGGHAPWLDEPERCAAALTDFLAPQPAAK